MGACVCSSRWYSHICPVSRRTYKTCAADPDVIERHWGETWIEEMRVLTTSVHYLGQFIKPERSNGSSHTIDSICRSQAPLQLSNNTLLLTRQWIWVDRIVFSMYCIVHHLQSTRGPSTCLHITIRQRTGRFAYATAESHVSVKARVSTITAHLYGGHRHMWHPSSDCNISEATQRRR